MEASHVLGKTNDDIGRQRNWWANYVIDLASQLNYAMGRQCRMSVIGGGKVNNVMALASHPKMLISGGKVIGWPIM